MTDEPVHGEPVEGDGTGPSSHETAGDDPAAEVAATHDHPQWPDSASQEPIVEPQTDEPAPVPAPEPPPE